MYETYFRLRELPFNVTPDPRFFYTHSSCQEAFATLCYGVEQRKGIVVITGEAGTGKTTLLKLFMQNAGPEAHCACILDPHLSFVELLRCAASVLGLPDCGDNRLALIEQLKHYLVEQLRQDHVVALLLDEAQDLNDQVVEELRLVSDLESGGQRLLQMALIGQPGLEAKLAQTSMRHLRQRITLRSRLMPLTDEEIGPYIDFRMRAAGYGGSAVFQSAAIRRVGFFSQGIPRLINVICDNALLIACATSRYGVGAETIDEVAEDLQLRKNESAQPPPAPPQTRVADVETSRSIPAPANSELAQGKLAIERRGQVTAARRQAPPDLAPLAATLGQSLSGPLMPRKWLVISAACSVMIVILGGAALWVPRSQSVSPVSEKIGQIQEAFAPLPGRILRVLTARPLWEDPFEETTRKERLLGDAEKRGDIQPFANKRLRGDVNQDWIQGERATKRTERTARLSLSDTGRRPASDRPNGQSRRLPLSPSGFSVLANSFVRNKPTAEADVIATLRPGTRIQVVSRSGDYLQIRSLETEAIRGYVHKEDAFFAPFK